MRKAATPTTILRFDSPTSLVAMVEVPHTGDENAHAEAVIETLDTERAIAAKFGQRVAWVEGSIDHALPQIDWSLVATLPILVRTLPSSRT